MATTEEMQAIALALFNNGYTPLRIDPDSKAARNPGWQHGTPTEETLRRDFARLSNLGVRCGDIRKDNTCLVGIDIDIEEGELIRCVERAIGVVVPVKRGKKGATYMVRMDRVTKTGKIQWIRDQKKINAIDVLATGAQTVVPPSIHPETKLPYQWIAGPKLHETDYRTLPVFGPSLLDEIRGFCKDPEDAIYALNDMEWAGLGGGGNTHDICVRAVSSMIGRQWTDEDIHQRIQRAKLEACEAAGMPYNWPEAQKVIQEWIDSSRDKKFDQVTKKKNRIEDVPLEIINRYVYVASVERMYDLTKGTLIGLNGFNNLHSRDCPRPWTSCLGHDDFRFVDKLTYSPGQPQFCKEKSFDNDAVLDCLNTYSPSGIDPEEGDVEPFLQLIRDVFDNDEGAIHHVLSFFAYMMQHPGARINHALVIQGEQGIGKDSIVLAIEKIIGNHNTASVSLKQVESQFNSWLFGKQMIVFQEMLATGRRNIYNGLKTYITDELHTINVKMLTEQRIPNRAAYIFLTNYKHALSIDPGDRRMWVWYSKMKPQSPAYYRRFYDWLSDRRSASHLLHYLLAYDTTEFKPGAPPPITEAKRQLIEASSSEVEQYLRQAVEACTWPMGCDLVSLPHLQGALRPFMRTTMSFLSEALDAIAPDGMIEVRPRIGGTRPRLRAIRNAAKWQAASAEALAKAYRMPIPPQQGETEGAYQMYTGSDISTDRSEDTAQEQY